MFRRIALLLMLTLSLITSSAWAHGGYFYLGQMLGTGGEVSTVTLSSHYLISEVGSNGSVGVGYRHGVVGILGLCILADLEYRFNRSALDAKVGFDVWLGFFGVRADLLIRQYVQDDRTRVGASIGAEHTLLTRSTIVYAGANIRPGDVIEGVFGLTWMFKGL